MRFFRVRVMGYGFRVRVMGYGFRVVNYGIRVIKLLISKLYLRCYCYC